MTTQDEIIRQAIAQTMPGTETDPNADDLFSELMYELGGPAIPMGPRHRTIEQQMPQHRIPAPTPQERLRIEMREFDDQRMNPAHPDYNGNYS